MASVTPDGPAAGGGIKPRDVILDFDGQTIRSMRDLPRAVGAGTVGMDVPLKVLRDGEVVDVIVKLGQLPERRKRMGRRRTSGKAAARTPRPDDRAADP